MQDGKISADEVLEYLRKQLAYTKWTKADVEDIIWEVDEDGDGAVDWKEFVACARRARTHARAPSPRA